MNRATWWPLGEPNESARMRLICFSYAGGGVSVFRRLRGAAPPALDICPLQLPGREGRIREPAFRRMEPLAEAVLRELRPWLHLPYAFFGHSMGALIGYELAHRAQSLGLPGPRTLFVSAARAPHLPRRTAPLHALPDAEFVSALRDLDGTPESVLAHRELMELMLPVLRADFELCETYAPRAAGTLPCPIRAFRGSEDPSVSEQDVRAWATLSGAGFTVFTFPGGHFFLESASTQMLGRIEESLEELRPLSSDRRGDHDGLEGPAPRGVPRA